MHDRSDRPSSPALSADYAREITGGSVQADGSIEVTEQWTFYPPRFGSQPVLCTRTATATLRPVQVACESHVSCVAQDPCARCVEGLCTPSAVCPFPGFAELE